MTHHNIERDDDSDRNNRTSMLTVDATVKIPANIGEWAALTQAVTRRVSAPAALEEMIIETIGEGKSKTYRLTDPVTDASVVRKP